MNTQWYETKNIPDHPNYVVASNGYVYRKNGDKLRRVKTDLSNGYERVDLDNRKLAVQRLVAEAFCERQRSDQDRVFHIDGDLRNNAATNLCWGSASEIQIWSHYTISYRKLYFPPKGE